MSGLNLDGRRGEPRATTVHPRDLIVAVTISLLLLIFVVKAHPQPEIH